MVYVYVHSILWITSGLSTNPAHHRFTKGRFLAYLCFRACFAMAHALLGPIFVLPVSRIYRGTGIAAPAAQSLWRPIIIPKPVKTAA